MLEIFELYENTFKNGIRRAQAGLAASTLDVDDVRSGLQEAEEELAKMNYEYSSTRNPQMKAKIDVYRKQLQNYKRDLQKQMDIVQTDHLFDGADRAQIVEGYTSNDKLKDAKKQMYDNLEMDHQISENLHGQTEALTRARGKLDNINGYLSEAHGLVNSIRKKMLKNKMVMWVVAAIFLVTLAVIIYTYI